MNTLLLISAIALFLNSKVRHYAWNIPEAYIPAILSLIPMFLAGLILGIIST